MRIAVLGAGSWGTTLAILLADNYHAVSLWSYRQQDAESISSSRQNPAFLPGIILPPSIAVTSDLLASVEGAEMIVTAVPSQFVRSVVARLTNIVRGKIVIVNVAKGVENGTLMTMSEVLHDTLPEISASNIATLSGPSHAEEVSKHIPTTVVAASADPETARLVQSAFMVPSFRVYASTDLRGVEIGGALKNVIAIAAGIIDGANLGDNPKAAVMTRGIAEIARVGVATGAHIKTFSGLSGIGDLMVTCMSRHSRNRHVGVEIGKGRKLPDILKEMVMAAAQHQIVLPDRELACAPLASPLGKQYLGAMRAAINCALANRQIITHLTRQAVATVFPDIHLDLLYDVSHNTCKLEQHRVDGLKKALYVHRKGATRAFGPGHPDLPAVFKETGQPVLIGGSMGTSSYVLCGTSASEQRSFSSAC
ncbi:MAG: NAD(P)H-dependent glycerol-3-phosphate dehydrogenase, partial [Deltaproteobacteria bacterium]